jgi:tetratricopeptide (TPR) repeat protein
MGPIQGQYHVQMKKTALYLFFFIQYCTALTAQLAAGKPLLSFTMPTDSIQLATKMMNDGLGMAATDTSRALRLLRTAARIFSRHQSSLQAGRCTMAVADIFFKAGMYNRAFANYIRAQDTLYETGAPDLGYAMLGVAKSQYHRGLYRFALKSFSELIEYAVKNTWAWYFLFSSPPQKAGIILRLPFLPALNYTMKRPACGSRKNFSTSIISKSGTTVPYGLRTTVIRWQTKCTCKTQRRYLC